MKTPLQIAILQCDTPPPDVVAEYGAYDRIFTTLLEKAADGLGLDPKKDLELSAYEVVTKQEYPNVEDVDAVLISGSSKYILCHVVEHVDWACAESLQNTTPSTTILGS